MNNDASLRLLDRNAYILIPIVCCLEHGVEFLECLGGLGDHPLLVVDSDEDAAGAVGIGVVPYVDKHALEARDTEEPRKVAFAEAIEPGVFPLAKLRGLDSHGDGISAEGNGGLVGDLDRLYLGERPSLLQATVLVLHGIAHPQPVDIEIADGVGIFLISSS